MNIGFIGCGNMGTAMINGILQSGLVNAENLIASAKSEETQNKIENELKIQLAACNQEVVEFSDIMFLAVKPQYYAHVIAQIKDFAEQNLSVSREEAAASQTLNRQAEKLQYMSEQFKLREE